MMERRVERLWYFKSPFYVFNAEIKYQGISLKKSLTTFFQRWNDSETIWYCCGKYPNYLMDTVGWANIYQIELLYSLFLIGEVKIDFENLKILYEIDEIKKNHNFDKSENFITISLIE